MGDGIKNERMFYRLEEQELTERQYQACCSDDLTTLVLAGAGTGKTSTLLGRIIYLWEMGKANQILALAFAVKAAQEIQQRVNQAVYKLQHSSNPVRQEPLACKASTFHSLCLSIVSKVEGSSPQLSPLSEETVLRDFLRNEFLRLAYQKVAYRQAIYQYFTDIEPIFKANDIAWRSLNDDYVLTRGELVLANVFYALDIPYLYQAHYARNLPNPLVKSAYSRKEPYCCSFYLPNTQLFIEVLPKKRCNDSVLNQQNILSRIHRQYGTKCLFYEAHIKTDFRLFQLDLHKAPTHSPGRMDDLFEVLWAVFEETRKQGISLQQLQNLERNSESLEEQGVKRCLGIYQHYPILLSLILPLFEAYENTQTKAIDFEHMILRATQYIASGDFQIPWSDIVIDEFQDISATRLALLQAMRQQKPQLRLFCVGDDWQTIYEFAGSQLSFIRYLERFLGSLTLISLDKTFRFHQGLCDISSRFIQQNPLQYRKQLIALREKTESIVLVEWEDDRGWDTNVQAIFRDIYSENMAKKKVSPSFTKHCLFLARFKHDLPSEELLSQWQSLFPMLTMRADTIHASKGTQADYVVLLNMNAGPYGLPSEKEDLLYQLRITQKEETFPFAQERRVFYVALTRAKERVYLCFNPDTPSCFLEEIQQAEAPRVFRVLSKNAY